MTYPLTTGNYVLILVGVLLIALGPYIVYRTGNGMLKKYRKDPKASLHWFSNGLNFLIAVLLFAAGILFVINNLRGNPLA